MLTETPSILSAALALTRLKAILALDVFKGREGAAHFEEKSPYRRRFKISVFLNIKLKLIEPFCQSMFFLKLLGCFLRKFVKISKASIFCLIT
jgi:hypothetical protein